MKKNVLNQKSIEKLIAKFAPVAPAALKAKLDAGKTAGGKNYPMDSDRAFEKRYARYQEELAKAKAAEEAAAAKSSQSEVPAEAACV